MGLIATGPLVLVWRTLTQPLTLGLHKDPHPWLFTHDPLALGPPPRGLWSKDTDPLLPSFLLRFLLLLIFFFFFLIYDFQPSRLLACCVWKW